MHTQILNSLGPSDAIWHQRSSSTLVQVMACCLMAPSHYQCLLIIVCLSISLSVRSHGIHLRALSLDDVKIPINKARLKIAVLKWHLGLSEANELSCQWISRHGISCAGQKTCIFGSELISSTWVKPNPRYNSKCGYNFYYLQNDSAWWIKLWFKVMKSLSVIPYLFFVLYANSPQIWLFCRETEIWKIFSLNYFIMNQSNTMCFINQSYLTFTHCITSTVFML